MVSKRIKEREKKRESIEVIKKVKWDQEYQTENAEKKEPLIIDYKLINRALHLIDLLLHAQHEPLGSMHCLHCSKDNCEGNGREREKGGTGVGGEGGGMNEY